MSGAPSEAVGYERTDMSPRVIAIAALAVAGGVALCLAVVAALFGSQRETRPLGGEGSFRHGPEEVSSIQDSWKAQDRAVQEHLAGYGWVDRQSGVVRIPVERAMDLLVEEQTKKKEKP